MTDSENNLQTTRVCDDCGHKVEVGNHGMVECVRYLQSDLGVARAQASELVRDKNRLLANLSNAHHHLLNGKTVRAFTAIQRGINGEPAVNA